MQRSQINKTFKVIDVSSDLLFLSFSVLYYYRMYRRCSNFMTPYYPGNSTFPMKVSDHVLACDCTASSSDSFVLVFKAGLFIVKSSLKLILRSLCYKPTTFVAEVDLGSALDVIDESTMPRVFTHYPRQLYQLVLLMNPPLFLSLIHI